MSTRPEELIIGEEILRAAQCEHELACLQGSDTCKTELYISQDVEVIRCRSDMVCHRKQSFNGLTVCTCPVKKKLYN